MTLKEYVVVRFLLSVISRLKQVGTQKAYMKVKPCEIVRTETFRGILYEHPKLENNILEVDFQFIDKLPTYFGKPPKKYKVKLRPRKSRKSRR